MAFNRVSKRCYLVLVLLVLLVAVTWWLGSDRSNSWRNLTQMVSWVYPDTVTVSGLKQDYRRKQLKILLVPGHDNEYGGAEFRGIKEADLNLLLAEKLFKFIDKDPHFRVYTAREFDDGEYLPALKRTFEVGGQHIIAFRRDLQNDFNRLLESGRVSTPAEQVHHNFAPSEVSFRLYGINKWANDKQHDLTLHLHFNDYPRRRSSQVGHYTGFAIYAPEKQYPNAAASLALAESIGRQLEQTVAVSDLPMEDGGIIEDQELIAIGANASRRGAALLIEYGYIYESAWQYPETRDALLDELAWQTYQGLKQYFDPEVVANDTLLLPYPIEEHLSEGLRGKRSVLALQKVLQRSGLYPPNGRSFNECPINGNFGPCVRAAVKAFQVQHQISSTGYVGDRTLEKLRELTAG
ncbi:MAG: N-acetylmuramoyl-L-alanine amidase [Patescibacteria group bacterium]|nr:N-acetylmuramoyl-L-alanine amidase [Patescibacteria group bacterium]